MLCVGLLNDRQIKAVHLETDQSESSLKASYKQVCADNLPRNHLVAATMLGSVFIKD